MTDQPIKRHGALGNNVGSFMAILTIENVDVKPDLQEVCVSLNCPGLNALRRTCGFAEPIPERQCASGRPRQVPRRQANLLQQALCIEVHQCNIKH
eukprot:2291708-Amphidinium_carterae.1